MKIDWLNFTPWPSLAGGLLIGLAAALFINLNGRVMGASSVIGGLFPPRGDAPLRLSFVAGLLAAPLLLGLFRAAAPPVFETNTLTLVVAGLLVGFGTRLGAGCTSGHGICGISRLSPRSIVATAVFMIAGIATVFLVRHIIGAPAAS
ncbi:MAG: YeeE/YedE family protein [Xanthobacteraceae bacterium]|nr:YeeE/YedE family protein [Xanthobacteraceae bacterium]